MKNIILILLVFLIPLISTAQQAYDAPSNYGVEYKRLKVTYSFKVPVMTDTLKLSSKAGNGDIIYVDGSTSTPVGFYFLINNKYSLVPTGLIDTTSLSNRINLKLNISDTSAMLAPYLRKIDTLFLSNRINGKLTKGGDTDGAGVTIGTKDNNFFKIIVNSIARVFFPTSGGAVFGDSTTAGYLWDFRGTGSSRFRHNLVVDNTSNSDFVEIIPSTGGAPKIRLFDAGAVDVQIGIVSSGLVLGNGGLTTGINTTMGDCNVNGGDINVTSSFGSSIFMHSASGNGINIRGQEDGVSARWAWGSVAGSGNLDFRMGSSATSPSTGNLALSLTSAGFAGFNDLTPTWRFTVANDAMGIDDNGKRNYTSGPNKATGTATLSGGTVTINNTLVTANSNFIITAQNCTNCGSYHIGGKTAGTSFVVNSSDGTDASTIFYEIID